MKKSRPVTVKADELSESDKFTPQKQDEIDFMIGYRVEYDLAIKSFLPLQKNQLCMSIEKKV